MIRLQNTLLILAITFLSSCNPVEDEDENQIAPPRVATKLMLMGNLKVKALSTNSILAISPFYTEHPSIKDSLVVANHLTPLYNLYNSNKRKLIFNSDSEILVNSHVGKNPITGQITLGFDSNKVLLDILNLISDNLKLPILAPNGDSSVNLAQANNPNEVAEGSIVIQGLLGNNFNISQFEISYLLDTYVYSNDSLKENGTRSFDLNPVKTIQEATDQNDTLAFNKTSFNIKCNEDYLRTKVDLMVMAESDSLANLYLSHDDTYYSQNELNFDESHKNFVLETNYPYHHFSSPNVINRCTIKVEVISEDLTFDNTKDESFRFEWLE